MSSFLPLESYPYLTEPRRDRVDSHTGQDAPKQARTEEHHSRHLNETLARFLHAFNLHFSDDPTQKHIQPPVDVLESKTTFTALVNLPGMSYDEVHVEANDHLFTVDFSGILRRQVYEGAASDHLPSLLKGRMHEEAVVIEHKGVGVGDGTSNASAPQPAKVAPEAEEKQVHGTDLHWHISERKCGHFHRVLQLPIGFVDMAAVKASMANGLLIISVPKLADAATKTKKTARKVEVISSTESGHAEGANL